MNCVPNINEKTTPISNHQSKYFNYWSSVVTTKVVMLHVHALSDHDICNNIKTLIRQFEDN